MMNKQFPILTDAESAVDRLDRLGKSDAEIADALAISRKTVSRHLGSARNKRHVVQQIIRLGLTGNNADQVMQKIGSRISDLTSERQKVVA